MTPSRHNDEDLDENKLAEAISETANLLIRMLKSKQDRSFKEGIVKFNDRVRKFTRSQLTTALHTFGTSGRSNLKITATNSLKRAKRGKIGVQPGAVLRRKV